MRRKQIGNIAEMVNRQLNLSPGFNIYEVVNRLGGVITVADSVDYFDNDYEAKIGHYENQDCEFEIVLAANKPSTRMRFSIAHEIGHYFLHFLDGEDGIVNKEYFLGEMGPKEWEANEFASVFLMPEIQFIEVAEASLKDGKYDVGAIAKAFQVTICAADIRGASIGLWEL